MVKDCFAGTIWNQGKYNEYIQNSKNKLEMMSKKAIKINPGEYRTYIAPAGVADIVDMFSWGGISESSLQQKDSALLKMRDENINLSPCFTLSEDFFEPCEDWRNTRIDPPWIHTFSTSTTFISNFLAN